MLVTYRNLDGMVVLADGTRLKVMRSLREEMERRLEALHDTDDR